MILTTAVQDHVRVATMDDGKANALSFEMVDALRATVAEAVAEKQGLVIAGRDGCFCAGFDLSVITGSDDEARTKLMGVGADLYHEMVTAPIPIVAASTGHALAAGALLLLATDYRIGGTGPAKVGLNEVAIGMALPPFAFALARHRLAPQHLTSATLFAEIGGPERAVEMGYLDALAGDVIDAAVTKAEALASLPAKPFAITKKRLRAPLLAELDALG